MPLTIIKGDITKITCDAIVNAANSSLLGGGGVDGAIHRAAGPKLLEECRTLNGCKVGEAKITKGYDLPSKFVIHTVGPVWHGGKQGEEDQLRSCYSNSLKLAKENGLESIAFPLISTGVYGYPKAEGLKVATDTITSFLETDEINAYIVVFDGRDFDIGAERKRQLDFILKGTNGPERAIFGSVALKRSLSKSSPNSEAMAYCLDAMPNDLGEAVKMIDESFTSMLLRKIDELGMTDVECYKKANIDRKHFSKIRSDINYKPKKQTALAFAIALELSLEETKELLMKAGYALSKSSVSDVIIEFFISNGNYNIFEINEALFTYDQQTLG
ncbi:MAG: O-acetyl-ADP-ribose deacetylase [Clostridiales bacterium]|nr:O-acetyl-ADP-ribose deacetylase [Clostridiales bacterium]